MADRPWHSQPLSIFPLAGCCISGFFPFFIEMFIRKSFFKRRVIFFSLNLKEMKMNNEKNCPWFFSILSGEGWVVL